ncbi:MAG: spermidine synthase [Planctomycetota bacterium]
MSTAALCAAMFLVSAATVLFTLAVWKLLAFFIMPSLFFDLLFVGFPVGAFLGVKFLRASLPSFRRSLALLQAVMLSSVAACLLCKHFDYLRAHLFEVQLAKLLAQMGTFAAFFLPFFSAYGLSEYVGYQYGTERFGGRMRWVYGVYLFGAATAYAFLGAALPIVGVSGAIAIAFLGVAAASLLLGGSPRGRLALALEALALAGALFAPGREERFLELYKGTPPQSTWDYRESRQYATVFSRWGRYSLAEILRRPEGPSAAPEHEYVGFYNDILQWEYSPGCGFAERMLGAVPIHFAPLGGRIAIIGAGGGRQVKWAEQERYGFEDILALEIEPAVVGAVRGPLAEPFARVYEHPRVRVVVAEARRYMEGTREKFDLIFLPSVGGYPQMMLEPGNMIRTFDAYRTLKDRLTDRGVLAIWYPRGLDPRGILTDQYARTLGAGGLGLRTGAYFNYGEIVILAAKDPSAKLPSVREIEMFLTAPGDPSGLPPRRDPEARPYEIHVLEDPGFRPIGDDRPFLAGNVRHIFSVEQLYALFSIVAGFLAAAGAAAFAWLRKPGDPRVPGRSYAHVALLAVLIGANFILCEHLTVLALFRKLYVFHDALLLGAVSFLVLSGLGSIAIGPKLRVPAQAAAAALLFALVFAQRHLSFGAVLALAAPAAFVTGSFFPALFEACRRNPLAVFAMDAIGAALGSALSFFLPIAFGFSTFFPLAAAAFAGTALATWSFAKGLVPVTSLEAGRGEDPPARRP